MPHGQLEGSGVGSCHLSFFSLGRIQLIKSSESRCHGTPTASISYLGFKGCFNPVSNFGPSLDQLVTCVGKLESGGGGTVANGERVVMTLLPENVPTRSYADTITQVSSS